MNRFGYSFTIRLSDEQAEDLYNLSLANNSNPEDMIEAFVLDLLEEKSNKSSNLAKDYLASKEFLEEDYPAFCDWLLAEGADGIILIYSDHMDDIDSLYCEYAEKYGLDTSKDSYEYKLAIDSLKRYNDNLAYFLAYKNMG